MLSSLTACVVTNNIPGTKADGRPQYVFTATVLNAHRLEAGQGVSTQMPAYRLGTIVHQIMRGDSYIQPNQEVSLELVPGYSLPGQMQTCQFTAMERHPAYAAGVLLLNARILNCY